MNKLDRRNMIFFGLGTIGRDMFYAFEANALIYYLSNVLSLPLGVFLATSMVFTVLRVFDALNDPLMGLLVDNTRSRHGRFKPPMALGALAGGACYLVLFADFGLRDYWFVAAVSASYPTARMSARRPSCGRRFLRSFWAGSTALPPSVRLRRRILRKLLRFSCGSLPDGCKSRTLRWKRPRSCPSASVRSAQTSRAGPEACAAGSRPGSKARRRSCCCATRPCGRSAPSGSRGACR